MEQTTCPNCHKPLPAETILGLCPPCLLASGFSTGPGGTASPVDAFPTPEFSEVARLFPQLEVLEVIGKGGMGVVYKARQPELNRFVALKILASVDTGDRDFAERFNREARALARLSHPNIVAVHDHGRAGVMNYLLMEFVDGANLREVVRAGRLSPAESLAIVPQLCEALQFAHGEGIVHRDIKPENILLDKKGRVKITDFGIAKIVGFEAGALCLTGAGEVIGTPQYMAPEQVEKPLTVDHRADIYSLGVVFYELLTGELPLGKFAPPSAKARIDVRLDEVVLRALENDPGRRYQHAREVKDRVETIAKSYGEPIRENRWNPLGRAGAYVGLAAILVAVGLGIALYRPAGKPGGSSYDACQIIRYEVGRQLREMGAVYDELDVEVAIHRDQATPYRVRYRGLEGLKGPAGIPGANGEFIMEYLGEGRCEGTLVGRKFTVVVGSTDNIELPFENDPAIPGEWETVDFVRSLADFSPGKPTPAGGFPMPGFRLFPEGKTQFPRIFWTKGWLLDHGDKVASRYVIRAIGEQTYLFFEWKSGDVAISGKKPSYYVLRKKVPTKEDGR